MMTEEGNRYRLCRFCGEENALYRFRWVQANPPFAQRVGHDMNTKDRFICDKCGNEMSATCVASTIEKVRCFQHRNGGEVCFIADFPKVKIGSKAIELRKGSVVAIIPSDWSEGMIERCAEEFVRNFGWSEVRCASFSAHVIAEFRKFHGECL